MDEKLFTPIFLAQRTDLELVVLQHDLRQYPEDRPYLNQVLEELKRRASGPDRSARVAGTVGG